MTATRKRKGDTDVAALEIPREEAIAAKRSLQSALELSTRARANMLPGPQADALDHISRLICVGITVLRDADSESNCGMRKTERSDPSDKSASSSRLPAPRSTPPGGSP